MEELSYDLIIQEVIDEKVSSDGSLWRIAGLLYLAKERMKASNKMLSADTSYSPDNVGLLVKTFQAFPLEDDRVLDLTFSHHSTAASTDNPRHWLQEAADNGWSVRDLKRAIKGEAEEDPLHEAIKAWEKITKLIEKGGDIQEYLVSKIKEYQK